MSQSRYEEWVPEKDRNSCFRIEQSLGELENNTRCREAASTLFWQIYFRQYAENTDLSILLNSVYDLVVEEAKRRKAEAADPGLQSSAFVTLHLVTILLRAVRDQRWGSGELVDDLVRIGASAFGVLPDSDYNWTIKRLRDVKKRLASASLHLSDVGTTDRIAITGPPPPSLSETEELRQQALSAVAAMFCNEVFRSRRATDKCQEALEYFAWASSLWCEATHDVERPMLGGELSLQEAVDCFESLTQSHSAVSSWGTVAESCGLICDSLEYFPFALDLWVYDDIALLSDQELKDRNGQTWTAISYWRRAATRAEFEMTPTEFVESRRIETNTGHAHRLNRDFFGEDWDTLENDTRRALLQMEINWYEGHDMGGRPEEAAGELRLAFEYEVRAAVFATSRPVESMLEDPTLMKDLGFVAVTLPLRKMLILLREAGKENSLKALHLRQVVEGSSLPPGDKKFLYEELPGYLEELVDIRNKVVHPEYWRSYSSKNGLGEVKRDRDNVRKVREKALGIGGPSYLRRLISIKKVMTQS